MLRHGIIILYLLIFSGCSPTEKSLTAFSEEWLVMGTVFTITVYRLDDEHAEAAADLEAAFAEVTRVDEIMSLYRDDSELSMLHSWLGESPVEVSKPLFDVLAASQYYGNLSRGALDVTVQPLVEAWGFYAADTASVPSRQTVEDARKTVGMDRISLDHQNRTVALQPGTRIDLGAIAKGYAVDQAVAALRQRGVNGAIVNLGGTVRAVGQSPDGEPWTIGVQHPRTNTLFGEINLANGAVATSGDYDRFFEANGKRYSHIIDPRTGYPVQNTLSVTVVAPTAMAADALSTAAFVLGPRAGLSLLAGCQNIYGVVLHSNGGQRPDASFPDLKLSLNEELTRHKDATFTEAEGLYVEFRDVYPVSSQPSDCEWNSTK